MGNMEKIYNKLVIVNIPKIIDEYGKKVVYLL